MSIFVRVNAAGHLQSYLGDDLEYANFVFNKCAQEGDTLTSVNSDEYARLTSERRYREECRRAALKIKLGLTV